jgi:hypothetical protein
MGKHDDLQHGQRTERQSLTPPTAQIQAVERLTPATDLTPAAGNGWLAVAT